MIKQMLRCLFGDMHPILHMTFVSRLQGRPTLSAVVLPGRTVICTCCILCVLLRESRVTRYRLAGKRCDSSTRSYCQKTCWQGSWCHPNFPSFLFVNRIQTLPDAVSTFSFTSSPFDFLNPTYITFSLCRLGHVTSEILFWKINCSSWLICEYLKVEFETEAPTVWLGSARVLFL